MANSISSAGLSKLKMVFGVPFYGRGWLLADLDIHGLGSPAMGQAVRSNHTKEPGVWAFYEICQNIVNDKATNQFDDKISASYAYTNRGDAWWIGYNDKQTVRAKVMPMNKRV